MGRVHVQNPICAVVMIASGERDPTGHTTESTSLMLIQRRNNVVCPVGRMSPFGQHAGM